MPDDIAQRLSSVRAVKQAPGADEFSIHKFFAVADNDEGRPLRTRPDVLAVFLKVRVPGRARCRCDCCKVLYARAFWWRACTTCPPRSARCRE